MISVCLWWYWKWQQGSFHPPGHEVELGVLCCPGGLRVGASPFPGWGCGLSIGKARGCLCQGMGSALPSLMTVQEEAAMQILPGARQGSNPVDLGMQGLLLRERLSHMEKEEGQGSCWPETAATSPEHLHVQFHNRIKAVVLEEGWVSGTGLHWGLHGGD